MNSSIDPLVLLDDADWRLLAEVGEALAHHRHAIIEAWQASLSEFSPVEAEKAQRLQALFAVAIDRFLTMLNRQNSVTFLAYARTLGAQLAEQEIPYAAVPVALQYLSRSYLPFLARHFEGACLKRATQVLTVLMQAYANVLAEAYLQHRPGHSDASVDRLPEIERMKGDLLSLMSHELRTPLSFIVAYASTLEENLFGELTPEQRDAVNKVLEGANRLNKLVDELLEAGAIETGRLEPALRPVAPGPLLAQAIQNIDCRKPGVAMHANLPSDLPPVLADAERMRRVIDELLSNACKFTEQGQIRVSVRFEGRWLSFEVRDTGIGMDETTRTRIFERFYQAEPVRTHHKQGIGLGMYIVRSLIDAMHGEIEVKSAPNLGTCVTFRLPIAAPSGTRSRSEQRSHKKA